MTKKKIEKPSLEDLTESYWENFSVIAAVIFGIIYMIKTLVECLL